MKSIEKELNIIFLAFGGLFGILGLIFIGRPDTYPYPFVLMTFGWIFMWIAHIGKPK